MASESSNPQGEDDGVHIKPGSLGDAGELEWVYARLDATSRSFAMVIRALPNEAEGSNEAVAGFRDAVALFYLALRALDTVEDDPAFPREEKVPELTAFHTRICDESYDWPALAAKCGFGQEKILLRNFHICAARLNALYAPYREVVIDITRRMGEGMAEFIEREVKSRQDYDLYCHYVAGLVGIGLSHMFAASKLEDARYATLDDASNSMGLCLQKTNITRDFLEDLLDKRVFWPREVWSKYATELADLAKPEHKQEALWCLNELVTDAVAHLADAFGYMAGLRHSGVFNFCAIPQVMAIATLAEIYDNHEVFKGVVKIPRALTEDIMAGKHGFLTATSIADGHAALRHWVDLFIGRIEARVPAKDPNRALLLSRIADLRKALDQHHQTSTTATTRSTATPSAAAGDVPRARF